MKKYLLTSFVVGLLFVGGGCLSNHQTDLNNTSTTPTTPTINPTTSEVIPAFTPTLIDKPISEWPRYEFKELGFSIQLPFVSSSLHYGPGSYCPPHMVPCSNTSTMYSYTGVFKKNDDPKYMFMGSFSKNYEYDRDGDITDISDIELGAKPRIIFFGSDPFKLQINPISRIFVAQNQIIVFNAYNDYYKNSSYDVVGKKLAFVFRLPYSKKFSAVIFSFDDEDFPLEKINKAITTLKFKKYNNF
jgi:hypothetical protein